MKKIIVITVIWVIVPGISFCTFAQSVKRHGHLKVDGTSLTDQHGNATVLRGMSLGWHNWWPRFYNPSAVKWLKDDWKCSVVRAALGVEPAGGYLARPGWSKEKIKSVVESAIAADIYVIIDWHSHNINLAEAKKFFEEMARTYGSYPHVIYEIFNEPDYESWNEVKAYSEEIISAIRAIDPDNIILVGTPHWDQDIHLAADNPIKGYSNIMYTVHFYAASHKQWLRERCEYAISKGIPLFVSESAGMEATGNGALNMAEWTAWIEWMEKNKISWITWSIADKDESCSVLLPTANSNGQWRVEDLKESGVKIRSLLREYAGTTSSE